MLAAQRPATAVEYAFPDDAGIIDVQRDFGANGDGKTDDTKAIQKAIIHSLSEDRYNPEFLYFPNGTYLVSDTLQNRVPDHKWSDGWLVGIIMVGQSRDGVVIKLKDNCPGYADPANPKPVVKLASEMQGKKAFDKRPHGYGNCAFRNSIINLTVDIGSGNPGAIGVAYLVSNRGSMQDVTIRSSDPRKVGHTGLDMTTAWPGPGLVRNVSIDGFDYGIRQKHMDCSMTLEHIMLTNQKKLAIEAMNHPTMSMRGIVSQNAVPVFRSTDGGRGLIMFLDSTFTYTGKGEPPAAVQNSDNLLLKHVDFRGYKTAVTNSGENLREGIEVPNGGHVNQYMSREPVRLFAGSEMLPDLRIKETPQWHCTDLADWANVMDYGAHPRGTTREFTSQVAFEQVDPKIDFRWGGGGPGKSLGNDNFAIRWTGQIEPPATGEYTFYVSMNDQARLWVNGKLLIDKWDKYYSGEFSGTIRLEAGKRVPIKLEYWESGHQAWVRLAWAGPGFDKQIIATENLYPTAEADKPTGLSGQYYSSANPDCADAIQKAIDSGKSVIYFPNGSYNVNGTVILRGKARKLIGMEANLKNATVRYDGGVHDTAFIEHLTCISVIHNCDKTLVIQRCDMRAYENTGNGTGDVFIDDTMGSHPRIRAPQRFWARQLNVEYGRKPLLINDGAAVWVLGMKTEGKFSQIINNGGVCEVYALYSMTNPKPDKTMPMIVNNEGYLAVSFADGGQKSFRTKTRETKDGETKNEETWRRETMMYIGGGPESRSSGRVIP
jgi:hypothetical protein